MREYVKKGNRKAFIVWAAFIIGIVIMIFSMSFVSKAQEQIEQKMRQERKQMEKEYIAQVRNYLEKEGYSNRGLTLTKIMDVDAPVVYQLEIHNARINHLKEEEMAALQSALTDLFPKSGEDKIEVSFF